MAVSLALVLLAIDWFKGRKLDRSVFYEKIPFLLLMIPVAWITYTLHARVPEASLNMAILIWLWTLIFYLERFLLRPRTASQHR